MPTTLSPSNLKTVNAYGDATWPTVYNDNMTLLNSTLLKLSALQDINTSGISNAKFIVYSAATGKWIPYTRANLRHKLTRQPITLRLART